MGKILRNRIIQRLASKNNSLEILTLDHKFKITTLYCRIIMVQTEILTPFIYSNAK